MELNIKKISAVHIITIVYLVGFIGLVLPFSRAFFNSLTPFTLCFSLLFLFFHHVGWSLTFILWLIFAFGAGFLSEFLGVNYGYLFGSYQYSELLGPTIASTPFMVGVLWIIVTYLALVLMNRYKTSWYVKAFFGAVLLVVLDYFIEPIAIKLNWWRWEEVVVPFYNYLSWFLVSFIILVLGFYFNVQAKNKLALEFSLVFVLFFVGLNFLLVYF